MKINYRFFKSDSIIKTTLWNVVVIIGFYLLFNFFAVIKLIDLADAELDKKIRHEAERVDIFIDLQADTLFFHSYKEFEESDFNEITANSYLLQIYNAQGEILFKSNNIDKFGEITLTKFKLEDREVFFNEMHSNVNLRTIYRMLDSRDDIIIQLATFRSSSTELAEEFEFFALITFPVVLVLILISSLILSRKAYSNINNVIDLANEITANNLGKRIIYKASKNDVLGKLRDTLNELFDRLENQVSQITEFTNNASHQLMSPLTAIKSEIEYLQKKEREKSDYMNSLAILGAQTDRLINLTRNLLILAKESENIRITDNIFSLNKLIESDLANAIKSDRVVYEVEEELFLRGNFEYFLMVLYNLTENSLKYSDPGQPVIVRAARQGTSIIINVIDHGIGISDADKPHIFDKFFRGENSQKSQGYGLGLSLAFTIVRQMKGTIRADDNLPSGTSFTLIFPSIRMES